ncbi:MAG: RDD family protein [Rhizobiales bacterium]|jgi:uncharacterized RDD family membrane protein YckC|nr:RDD family protein [Hyphomicrobiales bacterium]MDQ3561204.1 RDD family protein [Pseudomonadota bacterium]
MSQTYAAFDAGEVAYDPAVHPERYEGVRSRRMFAFLIDAAVILSLMLLASLVIAVLGVFTFGLGWFLLPAVWPVVAILYEVLTKGGSASATPGMRFVGIELRTQDGERLNYPIALLHSLGFWFSVTLLTPVILVVSLFTPRKQLLHDLLLGTVAVRSGV